MVSISARTKFSNFANSHLGLHHEILENILNGPDSVNALFGWNFSLDAEVKSLKTTFRKTQLKEWKTATNTNFVTAVSEKLCHVNNNTRCKDVENAGF